LKRPYIELYQLHANDDLLFRIFRSDENDHNTLLSFYKNPILPSFVIDGMETDIEIDHIEEKKIEKMKKEYYQQRTKDGYEWDALKIIEDNTNQSQIKWIEYTNHIYCSGQEIFFEELRQNTNLPDPDGKILFDSSSGWWNENSIKSEDDTFLLDLVSAFISIPIRTLREIFKQTNHIGPIRELPKRDHVQLDKKYFTRWVTGIAAYELLLDVKTSRDLIKEINEWLSSEKHFNTGYRLDIKKFKKFDIESELMAVLKSEKTDLNDKRSEIQNEITNLPEMSSFNIIDISREIKLSMQDVGTGISQILPIVVGILGLKTYFLSIEQPELHIHPAMQAEMGDLFINSLNNESSPNLIIETHSEHIMLRILRRIRETKENESNRFKVHPDDVAVYYVINDRQISDVIPIPITDEGDFAMAWPHGFFPERGKELFS
jgi:hypothetical protein